MSTIQILECILGTRHEAEAGALILKHARAHLLGGVACVHINRVDLADVQAAIILFNLSLLVFPEQEPKIS